MQASFPVIDRGPFLLSPALRSPLAGTASLDSLPAETRLLLALATAAPDDVRSGQAEAAACEIDDWDRFARIVSDHKVLPLVYPNLKRTCGTRIPDRTMADMKRRMLASAQHNLLLATEMVSLHDRAEAANLAMLAFKGPILTAHAYGDLTRREFGDLDLLVRPSDVDRAATLLTARGYRESTRLNLSWERTFVHDERNIEVDLHWAIAPTEVGPYSAAFRYDLDGLWDRRRSLKILNREVQTFGAEDTLITLCQNSVKDFFRSTWPHLSWFCDLAHVMSAEHQMDWRTVDQLSTQFGCRRIVNACIDATAELFGLRIDRPDAGTDRPTNLLAKDLCERLLGNLCLPGRPEVDLRLRDRMRFHWLARERWLDRLAHLVRPRLLIRAYRYERQTLQRASTSLASPH